MANYKIEFGLCLVGIALYSMTTCCPDMAFGNDLRFPGKMACCISKSSLSTIKIAFVELRFATKQPCVVNIWVPLATIEPISS